MSELKAFRIIQGDTGGYGAPSYKCDTDGNRLEEWCDICEVYDKSEADKVIEELKEKHKTEVKELLCLIRDKENNFNRAFDSEEKEIRHQKYKRCVKIAERCFESREYWRYRYGDYNDKGYDRTYKWRKVEFWGSWGRRWLELAEKFKEA